MSSSMSLEDIARRVNWYTEPALLLKNTRLFLSQVMARGSTEDITAVLKRYSTDDFREAYQHAPPGLFSKRAWAYWGLMLLNNSQEPLPERSPGANLFDWRKANKS
jgi:hypothetical protein